MTFRQSSSDVGRDDLGKKKIDDSQNIHDMFGLSEEKIRYMDQMMESLDNFIQDETEVELVKEYYNAGGPNIIIMSDAAKPIYCRYGNEDDEDYTNVCSLIQAIRGSINDDESIRGDLQYLEINNTNNSNNNNGDGDDDEYVDGVLKVAFVSIGAITLVAISNSDLETECYLRLQLEYVYGQIIFTLTDHVQKAFQRSPNLDIRNMLGSTTNLILDGLLESVGPMGNGGPFLVSGVEAVGPIPFPLRNYASHVLVAVCEGDDNHKNRNKKKRDDTNNNNEEQEEKTCIVDSTLFAMLIVGKKLVTMVQPKSPQYHLHTSDIHLIINYVDCQPGVLSNELWFPICLPRFNSSGFVHAFATCIDTETNMSVVLISQNNSTEQFELFRAASLKIRKRLNLPTPKDSKILRATTTTTTTTTTTETTTTSAPDLDVHPIEEKNNKNSTNDALNSENNYQNNADDEMRYSILDDYNADHMESINEDDSEDDSVKGEEGGKVKEEEKGEEVKEKENGSNNASSNPSSSLPKQTSSASTAPRPGLGSRRQTYSNLFHYNKKSTDNDAAMYDLKGAIQKTLSLETQKELIDTYYKIAQAMHFVFRCDVSVRNHETGAVTGGLLTQCLSPPLEFPFIDGYSKRRVWSMYQRLSLRLRLGSASTESTMDAFDVIMDEINEEEEGIGQHCPAQRLMETPPNVHGVSYIVDANELFVALNGKDFELYATLPATVPPKTGTMHCARLVRRIWADEGKLFLACPLSWRV